MARVGGIIAPQNKALSNVSLHLPFTVNGGLTLISGLICLFLADTYTAPMKDHLEEDEETPRSVSLFLIAYPVKSRETTRNTTFDIPLQEHLCINFLIKYSHCNDVVYYAI